jgi:YHS domain-containing protein
MKRSLTKRREVAQHNAKQRMVDVVCGMEIDPTESRYFVRYHDVTYYFCSAHCRQHFENTPARYVG